MNKLQCTFSISNGLRIANKAEMDHFIKQHEGKKGIIEITILGADPSKQHIGYFKGVVIPAFQKGFENYGDRRTVKQIEEYINYECPYMDGRKIEEYSKNELNSIVTWCQVFAGEELQIKIS